MRSAGYVPNMWDKGVQTAGCAPMDTNAMMGTAAPHAQLLVHNIQKILCN